MPLISQNIKIIATHDFDTRSDLLYGSFQTSPPQISNIFLVGGGGTAVYKAHSKYRCQFSSKGPCFKCWKI